MRKPKTTTEPKAKQSTNKEGTKNFSLARVYIKEIMFESAKAPTIFEKQWSPKLELRVDVTNEKLRQNLYEVVLKITVTVKTDDEIAFLVNVKQAGVFALDGFDEKTVAAVLESMCPNILFPYAREAIDSLAVKGTFPAPMLAPINFDALMKERQKS
jgi:preprotein translocase subunit SecB